VTSGQRRQATDRTEGCTYGNRDRCKMSFLLQFDRVAFAWINTDWSNRVFDVAMPWFTHFADAAFVWIWIVFMGLLAGRRLSRPAEADKGEGQRRTVMKTVVLSCLYMALIYGVNAGAYKGLKHVFHRSRPFMQQTVMLRVSPATASGLGNNSSFPSGHAANAFMIAALLAEMVRRKRCYLYGMAALVALSRIYLGVHYPGDVLAGSLLGLSITWLMLYLRPLGKQRGTS
jgi:undecaprenyl-diphosphatase